jgi:hypothetical protein
MIFSLKFEVVYSSKTWGLHMNKRYHFQKMLMCINFRLENNINTAPRYVDRRTSNMPKCVKEVVPLCVMSIYVEKCIKHGIYETHREIEKLRLLGCYAVWLL